MQQPGCRSARAGRCELDGHCCTSRCRIAGGCYTVYTPPGYTTLTRVVLLYTTWVHHPGPGCPTLPSVHHPAVPGPRLPTLPCTTLPYYLPCPALPCPVLPCPVYPGFPERRFPDSQTLPRSRGS